MVPLSELDWDEGDILYIGRRVMREGSEYDDGEEDDGWAVMDRSGKSAYPLYLDSRESIWFFDHYDFGQTLGRHLQPGERLVVTYEG